MKRLGHCFNAVTDPENLAAAFYRVKRGKGGQAAVRAFAADYPARMEALRAALAAGTFRFGTYHFFKVFDPKERVIAAAALEERIVHHALIAVCGERLEKGLVDHTYACRKGKGQLKAVAHARRCASRHPWCLKLDIRRYFDSIDHAVLLAQLRRKIKDTRVLALFAQLIASYETAPGKGLPIGNLTSQYFANLYLDPFDRRVTASGAFSYARYMDDMVVFGDYAPLKALLREAKIRLAEDLTLEIKGGGSLHRMTHGVDFLGIRIFPDRAHPARDRRKRFVRKVAGVEHRLLRGTLTEHRAQQRLTALFACFRAARHREQPRDPRRELEQQRPELPFRESQQQQQQQLWLSLACRPASSNATQGDLNRPASPSGITSPDKPIPTPRLSTPLRKGAGASPIF